MSRTTSASFEAFGVGVVSGMRTLLMPALLSRAFSANPGTQSEHRAVRLLRSPTVSNALIVASVSELVGDKLPMAPDRRVMPSLVARAASGGFAATVLASRNGKSGMSAAALGAVGAIVSAEVMVRLRTATGRRLNIPDPLVGLAEDCCAFVIGQSLISVAERNADIG